MKNRQVMSAIAGALLALVTLLYFDSATLLSTLTERYTNHIVGFILIAFLIAIAYEDWKDARRNDLNRGDRGHPC